MAKRSTRLLLKAAAEGDVAGIRSALAAGADVDGPDSADGRTALIVAVIAGHPEAVEVLIQAGADLEVRCKGFGLTALGWTGSQPRGAESARLLLAAGADIEARQKRIGATPLLWAVKGGGMEIVEVLLDAGADVTAVDALGDNVLSRAAQNPAVVELLVAHGAPPAEQEGPAVLPWPEVGGCRPDYSDPVRLVRGFVLAMDSWETRAAGRLSGEDVRKVFGSADEVAAPYLSERRCYEPGSVSSSPQFSAASVLVDVRRPSRARTEVVVQKSPQPPVRYEEVFAAVLRNGEWRIDAVKERMLVFEDRYRNVLHTRSTPPAEETP